MYFSQEWCRQIGRKMIKIATIDGIRLEQRLDQQNGDGSCPRNLDISGIHQ